MAEDFTADFSFTTSFVSLSHTHIHTNAESQDETDIQVLLWLQVLGTRVRSVCWTLGNAVSSREELLRRGKVTGSVDSRLFQLRHSLPHWWNHLHPTGHQATSASRRWKAEVMLLFRWSWTANTLQKLIADVPLLVLTTSSTQIFLFESQISWKCSRFCYIAENTVVFL